MSMMKVQVVFKYLGFLKGTFSKGLFYILYLNFLTLSLCFLAFADFKSVYNIIAGAILAFGAVFNMFRYCGGHRDERNDEPMLK